eukprot:6184622-Pleurochrysis_carterae.AAC.3
MHCAHPSHRCHLCFQHMSKTATKSDETAATSDRHRRRDAIESVCGLCSNAHSSWRNAAHPRAHHRVNPRDGRARAVPPPRRHALMKVSTTRTVLTQYSARRCSLTTVL